MQPINILVLSIRIILALIIMFLAVRFAFSTDDEIYHKNRTAFLLSLTMVIVNVVCGYFGIVGQIVSPIIVFILVRKIVNYEYHEVFIFVLSFEFISYAIRIFARSQMIREWVVYLIQLVR